LTLKVSLRSPSKPSLSGTEFGTVGASWGEADVIKLSSSAGQSLHLPPPCPVRAVVDAAVPSHRFTLSHLIK